MTIQIFLYFYKLYYHFWTAFILQIIIKFLNLKLTHIPTCLYMTLIGLLEYTVRTATMFSYSIYWVYTLY